jgi:hypothetical protein
MVNDSRAAVEGPCLAEPRNSMLLDVADTTDSPGFLHLGGYPNSFSCSGTHQRAEPDTVVPSSDAYRAQRRKTHNSADTTAEITMHVTIGR